MLAKIIGMFYGKLAFCNDRKVISYPLCQRLIADILLCPYYNVNMSLAFVVFIIYDVVFWMLASGV